MSDDVALRRRRMPGTTLASVGCLDPGLSRLARVRERERVSSEYRVNN